MSSPSHLFRFAPSPNGRLHLGHAYSALLNAAFAAQHAAHFLLRIEDIDTTRCKPEYIDACMEDLHWLGISWEKPVRIQSHYFHDYVAALESLKNLGVIYPCFCSRSDIAKVAQDYDPDGALLYPGTCKNMSAHTAQGRIDAAEPHSWRLDMQASLEHFPGAHHYTRFDSARAQETVTTYPARWGDAILARKETPTSYHLSVVVDDALQGISHIVRGQDLEAATDLHVLLQRLLGFPTPLYHHHELLVDDTGDKLAKSKGSETLADLRARGVSADDVKRMLGF